MVYNLTDRLPEFGTVQFTESTYLQRYQYCTVDNGLALAKKSGLQPALVDRPTVLNDVDHKTYVLLRSLGLDQEVSVSRVSVCHMIQQGLHVQHIITECAVKCRIPRRRVIPSNEALYARAFKGYASSRALWASVDLQSTAAVRTLTRGPTDNCIFYNSFLCKR